MRHLELLALAVACAILVVPTTTKFQPHSGYRMVWDNDCSYNGNNYRFTFGSSSKCANVCAKDAKCTHWAWKPKRGGMCWLKKGNKLLQIVKQGAKCGHVVSRGRDPQVASHAPAKKTRVRANQKTQVVSHKPAKKSRVRSSSGLSTTETREMLSRINAYRTQNGLRALTINKRLVAAAYLHSKDQAKRCTMTHTGSNGSHISDRVKDQGYDYATVAENVAAGQTSVDSVMTSWWNSPGHRANLLNEDVTNVGFAKVVSNDCDEYATYWTQDFGVPKKANDRR